METFASLEKKLKRLSKELSDLKEIKQKARKEYKEAEEKWVEAGGKYNLKKSEVEALKSGLEYLYEKKLNMII
jgi:chromosome segregation ATPase